MPKRPDSFVTVERGDGGLVRPLPVRLRPKTGESTDSYIRRLARANHLKPSYLRGYLVGPPDYGSGKRPRPDRLAAITGRRQDVLERALPDLVRQKRAQPDKPKRRVTRLADKPALFAAIRKDAQAEQLPVSHLAKRHHVSQATVRQALKSPTPPPRKKRPPIVGPAKERVGPIIDAVLREYAAAHAGRFPTVREVWEKLLDDHDATVSYGTVHRYMSGHPLNTPDTLSSHAEQTAGNYLAVTQQTFHAAVFKQYRELLTAVRREPTRHGLDNTFASTTAFVLGLDAGTNWTMLTGFHEWLVIRRGTGHDLTWPILVRHLAPGGWIHPLTQQADLRAVTTLHQLLSEYFNTREQPGGLSQIFRDYQTWLTTQARSQSETAEPDQIS
ncbi:TniQ family protein [Streptomyces sp. 8L]|uniref:TniQ family protein n=1 Tax=Streptomyces sp. 8L TaxID=2877242 RepID=UPI001CD5FC31|nr:TniQ family protein [Streptomyces sp. 8L]MCA1221896.1 TniQ family protein [Streptomyces sp. 8L]